MIALGDHPAANDDPATTAEFSDFPYWSHLARSGVGSAVYLGWGWLIQPAHVWGTPLTLLGVDRQINYGIGFIPLLNEDQTPTDLELFRIFNPPDLAPMKLASQATAADTPLLMAGFGRPREQNTTTWAVDTSTDPWSWLDPAAYPQLPTFTGYWAIENQRLALWGVNTVRTAGMLVSGEFGQMPAFDTLFSGDAPDPRHAQAVGGDSGGPAWRKVGDRWELAGVAVDVPTLSGQPRTNRTAIFDYSTTVFAELAAYREQILEIIKPALPGDFNDDGVVDTQDINAFVLALTQPAAWAGTYPDTLVSKVDLNGDGHIDTADINPFVAVLTGGAASPGQRVDVPEPATWAMLVLAVGWRRCGHRPRQPLTCNP